MTTQPFGKRWYDKHPDLSRNLEALKKVDARRRNSIAAKLMRLLRAEAPAAVRKASEQTRSDSMRRWYDSSPQIWTAVNALQFAEFSTIARSAALLGDEMREADEPAPGEEPLEGPTAQKP